MNWVSSEKNSFNLYLPTPLLVLVLKLKNLCCSSAIGKWQAPESTDQALRAAPTRNNSSASSSIKLASF
jgi:hypothetical protein